MYEQFSVDVRVDLTVDVPVGWTEQRSELQTDCGPIRLCDRARATRRAGL